MRRVLLQATLCLLLVPLPLAAADRELRVAAVQLRVSEADLASFADYRAHIRGLVERCLALNPDLILFPEYTSAFLALVPYSDRIRGAGSAAEALRRTVERDPLARSLRDLFLLGSGLAERAAWEIFGALARRHGVAIGAGTYFACDLRGGEARLVNRALIFDRTGELLHYQDKVFLTPFEEELLELEPGRFADCRPFVFEGRRIGLTICRDTFLEEWEERFEGADLWLDIKANGEPFTDEARERFRRALPERIRANGVPFGLTVCLTGELLDFAWEGESFLVVRSSDGDVRSPVRASSPMGEEILLAVLPALR